MYFKDSSSLYQIIKVTEDQTKNLVDLDGQRHESKVVYDENFENKGNKSGMALTFLAQR